MTAEKQTNTPKMFDLEPLNSQQREIEMNNIINSRKKTKSSKSKINKPENEPERAEFASLEQEEMRKKQQKIEEDSDDHNEQSAILSNDAKNFEIKGCC